MPKYNPVTTIPRYYSIDRTQMPALVSMIGRHPLLIQCTALCNTHYKTQKTGMMCTHTSEHQEPACCASQELDATKPNTPEQCALPACGAHGQSDALR